MAKVRTTGSDADISGFPNKCVYCHQIITPDYLYGYRNHPFLEVMMKCPNQKCQKSFIGYYKSIGNHYAFDGITSVGNPQERDFSETVNSISENFRKIYNQAYFAEQNNLLEICGVGYRKALEFLIKDYIISNNPSERENVERKMLGACISEYVNDDRIKSAAKRAVWLGNDETHYIRKWEGKNLEDLKRLIDLTIHWIEMETLSRQIEEEMPD